MTRTVKPNPGHNYIVHEKLGEGAWKAVYRTVYRRDWQDRALARFKSNKTEGYIEEIRPLLKLASAIPSNLAQIYDIFIGDDNALYLVEELLQHSLESLAPLNKIERILSIGADLSNGLGNLHQIDMVHRDMKLDNCGIDYVGHAKIFDLGAATSEGKSELRGNILTRAPELFSSKACQNKEADVWALGAVIYALRTGEYPFVNRLDMGNRGERPAFSKHVEKRVLSDGAEKDLFRRIEERFPENACSLLCKMLSFDPNKRPKIECISEQWTSMYRNWSPEPVKSLHIKIENDKDKYREGMLDWMAYLEEVIVGSVGMTVLQAKQADDFIRMTEKYHYQSEEFEELKGLLNEVRKSMSV